MKTYYQNNNGENLILFFCGWGIDEKPFSILKTLSDVLYVYDYAAPDFDCSDIDFSKYKSVSLLAFSFGVYASAIAKFPEGLKFEKSVAINGTLIPMDDEFGVPFKQLELTEKMDAESAIKFRQRLFGGEMAEEHFEIFGNNLPDRSIESSLGELSGIKNYLTLLGQPQRKFDKVYISNHDRCVPTRNQINFWKKNCDTNTTRIEKLTCGHFPFYCYESLEELF